METTTTTYTVEPRTDDPVQPQQENAVCQCSIEDRVSGLEYQAQELWNGFSSINRTLSEARTLGIAVLFGVVLGKAIFGGNAQ